MMGMTVTTAPSPTIEQVVIGQLVGFVALIDKSLDFPGTGDSGDEYAVIELDDAKNLRELLAGIAGAMTRQKGV
jgi:hypothetical protein